MKAEMKRALVLLIALLLTLGLYFAMGERGDRAEKTKDTGVVLYDFSPFELSEATITNEAGSFRVVKEGDDYAIEGVPAPLLNRDYLAMILSDLNTLVAEEAVEDTGDLSPYGLDHPSATVRAAYEGEESLELLIGREEPLTGGYYVKIANDDRVYLLRKARTARFFMTTERFVKLILIEPPGTRSPVAALSKLTIAREEEYIEIERVTEGSSLLQASKAYGVPSHMVTKPGVYRADESNLVRLSDMLLGLLADQAVCIAPTAEDLTRFGLDHPAIRFQIERDDRGVLEQMRLSLSRVDARWYAILEGVPAIYRLPEHIDFDGAQSASLISNRLPGPLLPDVTALSISSGNNDYLFEIEHEEGLNVLYEGAKIDDEAFRRYYNLLAFGVGDPARLSEAYPQEGDPTLEVVFSLQEGGDVRLAFFAKGASMTDSYLDKEPLFAVRRAFLDAVLEATEKLTKGESFATTW